MQISAVNSSTATQEESKPSSKTLHFPALLLEKLTVPNENVSKSSGNTVLYLKIIY